MKKIYKVLISILIISMLTVTAISAVTGPYTGCISKSATKYDIKGIFYYFQSGSTPMSPCKTGDDQITIYEKTYIDNALSNIQTQISNIGSQISSLTNRVTNLENHQTYSAIFSKTDGNILRTISTVPNQYQEISNLTFYLPISAYVFTEATGTIENYNANDAAVFITILNDDNGYYNGGGTTWRFYSYGSNGCYYSCQTGFQTSETDYLGPGNYTVHLFASVMDLSGAIATAQTPFTSITAILNGNGSLQYNTPQSSGMATNTNRPMVTISKDGKITISRK